MKPFTVALLMTKPCWSGVEVALRHFTVNSDSEEEALGACVNATMKEESMEGFSVSQKSVLEITPAS